MRRRKTNQLDMLPQAFRPLAHFWPAALRHFDLKVRFDYLRQEQVMLGDLAEALGLTPDLGVRSALQAAANLTPGDFAAVANQVRFLPIANALELAQRLANECNLKPESRRKIGFPALSQIERPS